MYRTKTYIAADWDNDEDAVIQLRKWNESGHWGLSFHDAHDLTSSRDSSLNCTIKKSLKTRMDASKTLVLIVGDHTDSVTAGSCRWCDRYDSRYESCSSGYGVDFRSFIKYECDAAVAVGISIIVLYNAAKIDKSKCPEAVRHLGVHKPMAYLGDDGILYWDYQSVKDAFDAYAK